MYYLSEVFRNGGIWVYLQVLLLLASLAGIVVFFVLNARGRRVRPALWWLALSAMLTVAGVGTAVLFWEVTSALETVASYNRTRMLAAGLHSVILLVSFSTKIYLFCGLFTAAAFVGSSMIRVGESRRWTFMGPSIALMVSVSVAIVMGILGVVIQNSYLSIITYPGVFLACGFLIAASGAFVTEDATINEELASDRWTVILLSLSVMLITVVQSVVYSILEAFQALERAAPESRRDMIMASMEYLQNEAIVGAVAVVGLVIIAAIILVLTGRVFSRTVLVDAITSLLVLVPAIMGLVLMIVMTLPFAETFDNHVLKVEMEYHEELDDP